ncbi:uncharacterized protein LOC108671234 [Hyalella azteca]|uniref:Uncharacterized protein LOC108671234 n=1 Tax=Hyalella azteca TaxID=294128 RepID=A0A8B7NKM9_HYAAZ|nr:uncharacterized protein LOC108671234 [Hyalella azteca]
MLFFKTDYMDDMWTKAVKLYRAGDLPGIIAIMTSTGAPYHRARNTGRGTIRFFCGPHTNRKLVLQYGQQLVEKMQYFCDSFGSVAYKADFKSKVVRNATIAQKNYLYRLPVPTFDHLEQRSGISSEPPIEVPSRERTRPWITEVVADFIDDAADLDDYCCWVMQFPKGTPHDSAWVAACRLYRSGELDHIAFIQTSTAEAAPGNDHRSHGVIHFYTRLLTDLKECRDNLEKKLDSSASFTMSQSAKYISALSARIYSAQSACSKKPQSAHLHAPQSGRLSAPQSTRFNTPQSARFKAPQSARFNTPQSSRFNSPKSARFKAPQSARFNTPQSARFNVPQSFRFNTPQSTRLKAPQSSRFNMPQSTRFNTPQSARFNTPQSTRFNTPQSARFNMSAGLLVCWSASLLVNT